MQNDIVTKQNEQSFLDRLAAQRHLYSKAKRLSAFMFISCVLIPVALAITKVVFPNCTFLLRLIVVYSFVATLIRKLLKNRSVYYKTLAAKIQQMFDCDLFGLDWNKALCGARPKPEEMLKYLKEASYDKLENWYNVIVSELPKSIGALVCMRTNVVYDQSLRTTFSHLCYVITIIALLLVTILGMINNTGIWEAFLYGIVPLLPLIIWGIDLYHEHTVNIKALYNLEDLIDTGLEEAKENGRVDEHRLNEIQNFMFLHRKTSYLIPDCFYWYVHNKQEQAAYYGAKEICAMYRLM